MKERTKFMLEWERQWERGRGRLNMTALCGAYGISRETGYVWVRRYESSGRDLAALEERSRRPIHSPHAMSEATEERILNARKLHPNWGPRKLRAWLFQRAPLKPLPAASTIGELVRRFGLSRPRRRRQRTPPYTQPFAHCDAANAVWCVDFKGHFRTTDGFCCYPLTIMDAHTRYLIRCEIVRRPRGREVARIFESAFREFGMPAAIRSDNGAPFASHGAGGLSRLSVWWLQLGIHHERIQPGKPQQNGRHERMHRTLKRETAIPPRASRRAQQRAFDLFKAEYNNERPHEALEQRTPASLYVSSPRPFSLPRSPAPNLANERRAVDALGKFRWRRANVLATRALAGEAVELRPVSERYWEVRYGPIVLGILDDDRPSLGLARPRLNKPARRLSGMSSV